MALPNVPQNQPSGRSSPGQSISTDFFVYDVTFLNLGPATTATGSIQIQADSDFEIQKLTQTTFDDLSTTPYTASVEAIPMCTVLITDTGTGRQLSDIAVPVPSLFGSAQLPFILPNTKVLAARAVLSIQISNLNTAITYSQITLSFIGRKIFRGFQ